MNKGENNKTNESEYDGWKVLLLKDKNISKDVFSWSIQKIQTEGDVKIKFTEIMRDQNYGVNLTSVNSSVLDVNLELSQKTLDYAKILNISA